MIPSMVCILMLLLFFRPKLFPLMEGGGRQ